MTQKLPQHVAMIMDGNGRWAERQGLPRIEGHRAGVEVVRSMIRTCLEKNIHVLSLFAFSRENWARPPMEVNFLMQLFLTSLAREVASLSENGIRVQFTGERGAFSDALQQQMVAAETCTAENTTLVLNIVINYGGTWDIVQATKRIACRVAEGELAIHAITESLFAEYLGTFPLPDPDLLIRTSGERRISDFFLWQLAYTELYFSDLYWPEFTSDEFVKALDWFGSRERRFGKTSEQVSESSHV